MQMSDESFWNSPLNKVIGLIDKHFNIENGGEDKGNVTEIKSMKQLPGWC